MEAGAKPPLYTEAQRQRRNESRWTLVQGILAPVQFVVFLISLGLVLRFLMSGQGFEIAAWSVLVKTLLLYTIMVTGSLWEKDVFGQYLFAPAFYWEDWVSMVVIALHTAYVFAFTFGGLDGRGQMILALFAYFAYVINAGQFLWKLRAARLQARDTPELDQRSMHGIATP
ncbi:MAG: 2-vinyl bacteriochlorophyllide hydratase [Burkholderiales bacterium]|nr:2-vinyl bacteriochlorophyllide hydratase [Burkholderiales bacterium]